MADEVYGEPPSNEDVAEMTAILALAVDKWTRDRARRTTVENAKSDPAEPMIRWNVEGDACEFCKKRGSFLAVAAAVIVESHKGCKCHPSQFYLGVKQRLQALRKSVEDRRVRKYLKSGEQPLDIVHSKYLQHCRDSKLYANIAKQSKYPPSRLTISEEECAELVKRYAGTGELSYNPNWRHSKDKNISELITSNGSTVGVVVNNRTGEEVETAVFKIHYGAKGAHIVPDYPSKKQGYQRKRNRTD